MSAKLPAYAAELFKPKRYKILYGGRGSSKSYSIAKVLLILGAESPIRVLCAREFQNSIAESVHFLLAQEIETLGLQDKYEVKGTEIIGKNGTEFIFKGVRTNINSIKSMTGLTHLWIEEAQTVSQVSWDVLIPTIRAEGSEIWCSFNPEHDDDPVYTMFVNEDGTPKEREDSLILNINWRDNPWFPDVLKKEKDYLFSIDPALAMHVWEGHCRLNSDSQIFKDKWEVRSFEIDPEWNGPYFGADWGFSKDPSTLIKLYINMRDRELMISHEKFGHGVDIDNLPEMYDTIPDVRSTRIRGDNSRPETISYMARHGFNIIAADKWAGSVEDGIAFIRQFRKVIIHTRCPQTAMEFKKYSYKVDRLTGDVTTIILDDWNHAVDAIRYALEPMISAGGLGLLDVL